MSAPQAAHFVKREDEIPLREVEFHPHSFADPAGRVFSWRGELYRAITPAQAPFISQLFREGIVQKLIQSGLLVETELTDHRLQGYGMVLSHRVIPCPSYPTEWGAAMFKDAARCIVDLLLELTRFGLTLKDAHPWNVLFDVERMHQPVWIDLNSLVPLKAGRWQAEAEFRRFCFNPLVLMSQGMDHLARLLIFEDEGVSDELVERLVRQNFSFSSIAAKTKRLISGERYTSLQQLRTQLEDICLPQTREQSRADSQVSFPPDIFQLLLRLQPASVLMLGGSEHAVLDVARMNNQVILFDTDYRFINRLYRQVRQEGLSALPLWIDFTKPTPASGLCNQWSVAASERLRCDLVIASAASIEKALLQRHLNFEQLSEGLNLFSNRWVLAELNERLIPEGLRDDFVKELKTRFNSVSIISTVMPGQVLLFGKK